MNLFFELATVIWGLNEVNATIDRLIDEIGAIHSKLILLIGNPGSGKTALLAKLGDRHKATVLNVGASLGKRLAALQNRQRALQANSILRSLAEEHTSGNLLLLDNIELLFDRSLKLDPLDLLKRNAHARRIVAAWPGELKEGRLTYADMGHPEYQDYSLDGVVPFKVEAIE